MDQPIKSFVTSCFETQKNIAVIGNHTHSKFLHTLVIIANQEPGQRHVLLLWNKNWEKWQSPWMKPRASDLSCKCSSITELQQPDNHQLSQVLIHKATLLLLISTLLPPQVEIIQSTTSLISWSTYELSEMLTVYQLRAEITQHNRCHLVAKFSM